MTTDEMVKAAAALVRSMGLAGGDKRLPKVYVVHGKVCWFLNQARREQYGTDDPIEELDVRSAWRIMKSRDMTKSEESEVLWDFENTGSLYLGARLFSDNNDVIVSDGKVLTLG